MLIDGATVLFLCRCVLLNYFNCNFKAVPSFSVVANRRRIFIMDNEFRITGELFFRSPPCLHVTWEIPFFFQLAKESEYSLESPEFPFADGAYCLRMFSDMNCRHNKLLEIRLVKLNDTVRGTAVSYEFGLMPITREEIHIGYRYYYMTETTSSQREFFISRKDLEDIRDSHFPDGTVTIYCSVRLIEPSGVESPTSGAAESQVYLHFRISSQEATNPNFRWSGKLSFGTPPFLHVTWKIPVFYRMAKGSKYSLQSPEFSFANGRYCLRLFSTGQDRSAEFELVNLTGTIPGTDVCYEVVLKSRTGKEISLKRVYAQSISFKQVSFCFARSEIKRNRDSYVPDGTLTVYCFVRLRQQKSDGVETSEEELRDIVKLRSDYRQLLEKGPESDVCLVVCGREFRAHRCVLRARSPVFDAMFRHETAEKESGLVVFDDLDPNSFGDFLDYMYTGCVGAGLSNDNVFRLYQAADKYDVPTLRSECVAHMRRNLSVKSFCDFITVALRHQEEDLLPRAAMFFKENMARIVKTVKWKQFMTDKGTDADLFLIKANVPIEHVINKKRK